MNGSRGQTKHQPGIGYQQPTARQPDSQPKHSVAAVTPACPARAAAQGQQRQQAGGRQAAIMQQAAGSRGRTLGTLQAPGVGRLDQPLVLAATRVTLAVLGQSVSQGGAAAGADTHAHTTHARLGKGRSAALSRQAGSSGAGRQVGRLRGNPCTPRQQRR